MYCQSFFSESGTERNALIFKSMGIATVPVAPIGVSPIGSCVSMHPRSRSVRRRFSAGRRKLRAGRPRSQNQTPNQEWHALHSSRAARIAVEKCEASACGGPCRAATNSAAFERPNELGNDSHPPSMQTPAKRGRVVAARQLLPPRFNFQLSRRVPQPMREYG